ncbi:hypothetical protein, partial [Phocaeicola vulgatus]|uniref:hypothetical protein n=1 Tax=Phocaeicola vulgatus TaxID=821 RepID=UPI001C037E66
CAPFLLTMQIIFASVSYRRVVADLRLTLHIVVYMKYVPNIQKGKVKIHPKDDKFKIVSSKESSLETK